MKSPFLNTSKALTPSFRLSLADGLDALTRVAHVPIGHLTQGKRRSHRQYVHLSTEGTQLFVDTGRRSRSSPRAVCSIPLSNIFSSHSLYRLNSAHYATTDGRCNHTQKTSLQLINNTTPTPNHINLVVNVISSGRSFWCINSAERPPSCNVS